LTFLPVAIGGGSIPVLSAASATFSDKDKLRRAFRVPNLLVQISIWPVTLVLLIMSPEILRAYGPNYQDGVPTFLWMIGGTAVGYMGYTCSLIVQSRGQMWFGLTHNFVYAVVSLAVSIVLLSGKGVLAIALGTAAGQMALLLWMLAILIQRYDFPADLARKVLESAAIMFGLVFLLTRTVASVPFAFRAAIALLCIAGFVWKSWSVPELRRMIAGRLPFSLGNRLA
jgi:O-antigen/teichoic acid export membrane protein